MAKPIKGGYKNVSLNNVDLATNNLVVDGLYAKLDQSYGKPIQLCGIVIDNVKKKNAFVQVSKDVNSENIIIENIYGLKLTINSDNEIEVGQAIPSELPSVADANVGDALVLDAQKNPVWGKGGTKLYKHQVILENNGLRHSFISTRKNAYTTIKEMSDDYVKGELKFISAVAYTGSYGDSLVKAIDVTFNPISGGGRSMTLYTIDGSGTTGLTIAASVKDTFVSDNVTEL